MRVFNSDGSEAERAGNGIRIFARYLKDAGYTLSERLTLETAGGSVKVRFLNDDGSRIQADMGKMSFGEEKTVTLGEERYSAFTTSIGNPHCVIPAETIDREKVCKLGKKIAESNMFKNGINVMLLQVEDKIILILKSLKEEPVIFWRPELAVVPPQLLHIRKVGLVRM